ncbi:hypothetical protein [Streptomyces sp. NBC_00212]|uniref:hypothetical protein n=1 Tax=Streptomyces sp. NBC_00212 TaxID=2975684 RepID=UPI00324AAB3A
MVAELVPGGFAAYLRVFHRFEASDGSGRTRLWRDWAEKSGVHFHAELSHFSLPDEERVPGSTPRWQAWTGQPDEWTRRAVVRALTGSGQDQPVYFAYDLAALLWGGSKPVIRRSSLSRLEAVRKEVGVGLGGTDEGPEFWWPQDRSWVVTSDHDLLSTYVGCSAEVAERILADGEIEALTVTPETRVDWYADEINARA